MYTPQIEIHAAVSFTVAGGVVTILSNTGKVASVTNAGAGLFDVTLQANEGVDDSLRFVLATPIDGTSVFASLNRALSTDTNLRINVRSDAGALTDANLNVVIFKKRTR